MHVPRAKRMGVNYVTIAISWLITLKLRMHEGIHLAMYLHASQLGCYRTCAPRTCKGRSQISRTAETIAVKFGTAMGTG